MVSEGLYKVIKTWENNIIVDTSVVKVQTREAEARLIYCRARVRYTGPTLNPHWFSILFTGLVSFFHWMYVYISGSESDSSSSSGSESDPEDDGEIKSALFMQVTVPTCSTLSTWDPFLTSESDIKS